MPGLRGLVPGISSISRSRTPKPWKAVKKNKMPPMTREEAKTCCQGKGRGSRLAKAHIEKAGADWMPIKANI
jgi:hypothetical protein